MGLAAVGSNTCLYPNGSKGLTLFLKGLLTAMRVLPATLPRNRSSATKLDLRGMPNLVKATLGGYWGGSFVHSITTSCVNQLAPEPTSARYRVSVRACEGRSYNAIYAYISRSVRRCNRRVGLA